MGPYEQIIYAQPESVLENEMQILFGIFEIETDHLISARRPDLNDNQQQQQKRTGRIVDFAVPADNWIKLKGREKRDST